MKPLSLSADGYRHFAPFTVTLPEGCYAVLGDNRDAAGVSSNGAGKSTFCRLIELCLFGPERGWRDELRRGTGERVEVCLVFEHGGAVLRVRRGFSLGSGKAFCDLERLAA